MFVDKNGQLTPDGASMVVFFTICAIPVGIFLYCYGILAISAFKDGHIAVGIIMIFIPAKLVFWVVVIGVFNLGNVFWAIIDTIFKR